MYKYAHPGAKIENRLVELLKKDYWDIIRRDKLFLYKDEDPTTIVPPFQEIIKGITLNVEKTKSFWQIPYKYKDHEGTTIAHLMNGWNPAKPSLIFHHGLSSTNHLHHLRVLADKNFYDLFNIFSIQAAHHENVIDVLENAVNTFTNLAVISATSVRTMQEIVQFHRKESDNRVVIAGFSMGGILTSWHYFHYNTADLYFPIISYPNFGEITLDKNHAKHIKNYKEMIKNESYFKCFEVPEELIHKRSKSNIWPVIGTEDELINYEKASEFWRGYHVTEFFSGHVSVVFKRNQIKELILAKTLKA
ncbi:MAG: YqiA/YcfP family alpha/beta fold hydrolase [Patescibacteria group bacterium]